MDELLGEFPFVGISELAHAVGAGLLPFVRPLIEGPTPLRSIQSPTPATGKSLLAEVLTIAAAGRGPAVMTEGRGEEEWRKRITAKLLQGPQFILIDNIRSRLDSAALSAALTSEIWEDRLLGYSRIVEIPVACTWLITGNNPTFSLEVARRTVSIAIDAEVERPGERTGFRHPNLRRWAKEQGGDLIWASLTLIQAWVAAGRPRGERSLGSYESWAEVIGGVLGFVGIQGFLGNRDRTYAEADQEVLSWGEFCGAWWSEFGHRQVGVDLLFGLATKQNLLLDIWSGRDSHAARTRFGLALSRMRDRVIGDFRVRNSGEDTHNKVLQYRLEMVRADAGTGDAAGG